VEHHREGELHAGENFSVHEAGVGIYDTGFENNP
jgi:hypothetical protein